MHSCVNSFPTKEDTFPTRQSLASKWGAVVLWAYLSASGAKGPEIETRGGNMMTEAFVNLKSDLALESNKSYDKNILLTDLFFLLHSLNPFYPPASEASREVANST